MAAVWRGLLVVGCLAAFLAIAPLLGRSCRPGSPVVRRAARLFCRALLRLLRVRVVVPDGLPRSEAGRLLVANHVSWLDVLVLGSLEPLCFLAKREVGDWPLISTFARLQGTVFVDRARRRSLPVANAAMAARLREGFSVALFPEGTTLDGSRLGRFHTSHLACLRDRLAAEPGLPACRVQAVGLRYSDPVAAWVGEATLLPHVWAVLASGGMTCFVRYGESLSVGRGHDRKELGRRLAGQVEALVAPPASAGRPALPVRIRMPL